MQRFGSRINKSSRWSVEAIIAEINNPGDAVVFTNGSVKKGVKSGWAYTVRVNGDVIAEGSGADGSQDKNWIIAVSSSKTASKSYYSYGLNEHSAKKVDNENLYADGGKSTTTIDYANMKAINIPTVQRLYPLNRAQ